MGDYTTRAIKFGWENTSTPSTMSAVSMTLNFNYLTDFEPSVREVTDSQFVLSGSRDQQRVAILQEEPDIRLSGDLMSHYPMYFAMGSINGTVSPYTIAPASTLPWISFGRYLEPVEAGEEKLERIWGCKVDTVEYTFEKGAVAKMDMNLLGTGATIDTSGTLACTVTYSNEGIYFFDNDVKLDGSALPEVSRITVSFNNNLERRLSVSTVSGYRAYTILEGGMEITGRLAIGTKGLTVLGHVLSRASGHTIEITTSKTHGNAVTGTITMPNVIFEEYPERLRGIEPYEVEIPYKCLPATGQPAVKAVFNTIIL